MIEAFGVERLMWGTDAFIFDHPYDEALDFLRASDEIGPYEKEMLLGGALRRVMGWPPARDGYSTTSMTPGGASSSGTVLRAASSTKTRGGSGSSSSK